MKKKIVIMGMAVLLLGLPCSACQTLEKEAAEPRRTQSAKSVVQAGIADTEINDRELQQAESEIVDGLELASWGTKVYDPVEHENVGGLAVSVTQVTYYTSLKDAGFSPDVIPLNDDAVKDVDGEDGEMLVAGELLDEDGNIQSGYKLLELEAEIWNERNEANDKDYLYVTPKIFDRNDLEVIDDEESKESGYIYNVPYTRSEPVYLQEAVDHEKNSFKVDLAQGESMTIHLFFFVPEDDSAYVGVVQGGGEFSGGFFSLHPDGT